MTHGHVDDEVPNACQLEVHPPGRGTRVPPGGRGRGWGSLHLNICGAGGSGRLGLGDEQSKYLLTRAPQVVFLGSRVVGGESRRRACT
jgi:hypothetical protein